MSDFDPKKVHLIERDDLYILFCKDTLEFFDISKEDADMARPIIAANPEFIDTDDIQGIRKNRDLNILQINISEDCNMKCSYCAADGGMYGREGARIAPDVAIRGIEILLDYYEGINNVQFFGGEPLLNFEAIKAVVEFFYQYKEIHPDFKLPRFNINTNGTIINDEILSFVKEHSIMMVISLDGPEIIHNRFRKNRANKDTFQQIVNNIHQIYEATGRQPDGIEMVYGTHFLEVGWTLTQALEYLESILPPNKHTLFVAPMVVNDESPEAIKNYAGFHPDLIPQYIELIQNGFEAIKNDQKPLFNSKINNTIRALMNKRKSKHFCIPSKMKIMIDALGNFVPCNALVNRDEFIIGKVSEPDSFKENIHKFEEFFISKRKTTHYKECANCWAFNLCSFCMTHIFKGEKPEMDEINPNICTTHRAITEEIVIQMTKMARDPVNWKKFLSSFEQAQN